MRFSVALLCYAIAVLLCIILPIFAKIFLKKLTGFKIKPIHTILGGIGFIISIIAYYFVLSKHLSTEGSVTDYYNTVFYRVTVVFMMTVLFLAIFWLIGMLAYAKRNMFAANTSFFVGVGMIGSFVFGIYCFLQLILMVFHYFLMDLKCFDKSTEAFVFLSEDGLHSSSVYVFKPVELHISVSVVLLSLFFLFVVLSLLINRIASTKIHIFKSILCFLLMFLSISLIVVLFVYMKQFSIKHYFLAAFSILMDGLALYVLKISKSEIKLNDEPYQRQFE